MVARLQGVNDVAWLQPYLLAAELTAHQNDGLSAGIAQAGHTVGASMSAAKVRKQAQSNWEKQFAATVADRQADNDRAMLPYLLKERESIEAQMADAMGDPELGVSADPAAQAKLRDRLLELDNSAGILKSRLMQSSLGGCANGRCGMASHPQEPHAPAATAPVASAPARSADSMPFGGAMQATTAPAAVPVPATPAESRVPTKGESRTAGPIDPAVKEYDDWEARMSGEVEQAQADALEASRRREIALSKARSLGAKGGSRAQMNRYYDAASLLAQQEAAAKAKATTGAVTLAERRRRRDAEETREAVATGARAGEEARSRLSAETGALEAQGKNAARMGAPILDLGPGGKNALASNPSFVKGHQEESALMGKEAQSGERVFGRSIALRDDKEGRDDEHAAEQAAGWRVALGAEEAGKYDDAWLAKNGKSLYVARAKADTEALRKVAKSQQEYVAGLKSLLTESDAMAEKAKSNYEAMMRDNEKKRRPNGPETLKERARATALRARSDALRAELDGAVKGGGAPAAPAPGGEKPWASDPLYLGLSPEKKAQFDAEMGAK